MATSPSHPPVTLGDVLTSYGIDEASNTRTPLGSSSAWGDDLTWNREYTEVRAIPSSLRFSPSRAFKRLERALGDLSTARVLDLGAGTGRHGIYAALRGAIVHAIDTSDVACGIHLARVKARGLTASIVVEHGQIEVSNLPDSKYDLIIDSYASCHILSGAEREVFLDALMTRLTPRGRLYTAGMGEADSFYRGHVVCREPEIIAFDPKNGVPKLLQPSGITARDGASLGRLLASTTEQFPDAVNGRIEMREVHASVLSR